MGTRQGKHIRLPWLQSALIVFWLVFTVSLTAWWVTFGMQQLELLISLQHERTSDLVRYQKMLLWEGGALVFVVLLGAAGIVAALYREMRAGQRMNEFFAAFTHEIRTPLAGMQLQAEVLGERIGRLISDTGSDAAGLGELLARFQRETQRFARQLENALALVESDSQRWYFEVLDVADVVAQVTARYPDLTVSVVGNANVSADRRGLGIVLDNLFQNALVHGQASRIEITVEPEGEMVAIRVLDNGRGFSGCPDQLGARFVRHTSTSGSGIGLYIARRLIRTFKGSLRFLRVTSGFAVTVVLPRAKE